MSARTAFAVVAGVLPCMLVVAAGCSSAEVASSPPANDAGETGFTLPDVGPAFEYPDSTAGHVAFRLAGCRGLEPGCHSESNSAGLVLGRAPAVDFAQLIGVVSTERPDLLRVRPGDPRMSWVYLKVLGDREAGVGTPMPLGSDGDPAFAATLAEWIDAGAPNPFVDAGSD